MNFLVCGVRPLRRFSTAAPRFLITGSGGQIGGELAAKLRSIHGSDQVVTSDMVALSTEHGPSEAIDVTDKERIEEVVKKYDVNHIIHLASLLSATGEKNPALAIKVNVRGIENVLECARAHDLAVYAPSSIAVFGSDSLPRQETPDKVVLRPTTIYGVSKVYLELLGEYYHRRFHVNFRSIRYPGVISAEHLPGGGTTDYAIHMFHSALDGRDYECFLKPDSSLPMMFMDDCIKATIDLINAPEDSLAQRTFNVTACSFSPASLLAEIQKHYPNFTATYNPDFRQSIADSWPLSIDDSAARQQWGWKPEFGFEALVSEMFARLRAIREGR